MKILIEEERSFRDSSISLSGGSSKDFKVILTDGRKKNVISTFRSPGSFLDGFLSENEAKCKAQDFAANLEKTLKELQVMRDEPAREEKPKSARDKGTRRKGASLMAAE